MFNDILYVPGFLALLFLAWGFLYALTHDGKEA